MIAAARIQTIQQELAVSNAMAKDYAKKLVGNRKYRQFRHALAGRDHTLSEQQLAAIKGINQADRKTMLQAEILRNELVVGFQNLVKHVTTKIIRCYAANFDRTDLNSQGIIYLVDAIYGYSRTSVLFKTYAHHVIFRELRRYVRFNSSIISANSSDYLTMSNQYCEAESQLLISGQTTGFHNVMQYLGITDEDQMRSFMGLGIAVKGISELTPMPSEPSACDFVLEMDLIYQAMAQSDADQRHIVEQQLQGVQIVDIAAQLGVSRETVRKKFLQFAATVRRLADTQESRRMAA